VPRYEQPAQISPSRQRIYRRRRTTIFGTLGVIVLGGVYSTMTLLAPLPAVDAAMVPYVTPVSAPAELTLPAYGASGIGAVGTDELLAAGGSTEPVPIASISKIITTLVVLDAKPIDEGTDGATLSFTSADVQIYNDYLAENGSVKTVSAGTTFTQREVIELLLIGSANNYAQSLVNWAFGSEEEYAVAANAWLTANGLTSTSVVDATGMSPLNVSTPQDLVKLGELALVDSTVSTIVAQESVTVPRIGELSNTNKLLGVDGIDGIKTGTLDEAGACLLFSADVTIAGQDITLVGVILGAPDHSVVNKDVRALLNSAEAGYHEVVLTTAGQQFGTFATEWGAETPLVATEDRSTLVWSDTPVAATVSADVVTLADDGEDLGSVVFDVGGSEITVPLETTTAIDDPGAWWRLTNPTKLF
jgi:D-alanyl-D-alanine carboxypeptidase (penicillin-binding protein 5/6)